MLHWISPLCLYWSCIWPWPWPWSWPCLFPFSQAEEVSSPRPGSPVFWTAISPVGHSRTIYHSSPTSADHVSIFPTRKKKNQYGPTVVLCRAFPTSLSPLTSCPCSTPPPQKKEKNSTTSTLLYLTIWYVNRKDLVQEMKEDHLSILDVDVWIYFSKWTSNIYVWVCPVILHHDVPHHPTLYSVCTCTCMYVCVSPSNLMYTCSMCVCIC